MEIRFDLPNTFLALHESAMREALDEQPDMACFLFDGDLDGENVTLMLSVRADGDALLVQPHRDKDRALVAKLYGNREAV